MRKLAAIMFTDIVGYTALMQSDEQQAAKIRSRHREVFNAAHEKHHGEIIQYYGDGTLSAFNSAIEAVECAIEMQRSFQKAPNVPLRIGVHVGDIVFSGTEIYGDGVNFAARVESLGVAGAILISKKVQGEIKNQSDLNCVSLGFFDFKNIEESQEIFAVSNDGILIPKRAALKGKLKTSKKSLAVLPFVNMSADAENEYFSDGLTEEILNLLVKMNGLKVIARTSSFAFKGQNIDVREIGRQLDAAYILEGSVRKSGSRVRITTQLIDSSNGFHLYSENYDRNMEDVFALQDEISLAIAHRLRVQFGDMDKVLHGEDRPTENIEAYDLYLKGRYYYNQWNATDARPFFEQAIELEETFALAHSYLGACYMWAAFTGLSTWELVYDKAKFHIDRAFGLNPDSVENLINLTHIKIFADWDWQGLVPIIEKMLQLAPGKSEIYIPVSTYYGAIGNITAFEQYCKQGLDLDPISIQYRLYYGVVLMGVGKMDEAAKFIDPVLQFLPLHRLALECKGWLLVHRESYDEAIILFEKIKDEFGYRRLKSASLGYAQAKNGNVIEAEKYLDVIVKINKAHFHAFTIDEALVLTAMERYDEALTILEMAHEKKHGDVPLIHLNPAFGPLMEMERFKKLLQF